MGVVDRRTETDGFQAAQCCGPCSMYSGEKLGSVLPKLSVRHDLAHQPFVVLRVCRVGQKLQVGQILDEVRMASQQADP